MKDNLEKFVGQNRNLFDDAEPSPGLWDGIENRLPLKPRVVRMRPLAYAASLAAVGLVVWIVTILTIQRPAPDASEMLARNDFRPELRSNQASDTVLVPVYIDSGNIQIDNSSSENSGKDLYAEITRYYDSEIAKRKSKLYSVSSGDEAIMNQVQEELALIDTLNSQTRNELGNGMNAGLVMEQLVQNYRQSIDILDMMLDQVNEEYAQINE
ncbi:hypothetical protein SDC9_48797 [bioreactor metagenome]|uniref:Uncharacterized protein n=1 Tax=bioreactor metagenome TaxID=1076179 RepID=A0A644WGC3_9ZZZZ